MVQASLPVTMLIPERLAVALKKSKTLLPVIRALSFSMVELVPLPIIAFEGRFAPAGPILELETVLLSFPVVVPVLKRIVPAAVANVEVDEPSTVAFVTVLFEASAIKRIVLEPAVVPMVVLEIVSEFPPVFNPLIVTLSAPLRLINGLPAAIAPLIVLAAPPAGAIVIVV
jgi:hypothetical protein